MAIKKAAKRLKKGKKLAPQRTLSTTKDIFSTLDGVGGESKDAVHQSEIQLESYK
jgi:hypothetical protein